MARALELAAPTHPHPNPRVGAVIADRDGVVVGEGFHQGPGALHAEAVALAAAGEKARGATVYVTLEPCTHHGRTPPCVDALLEAGVARVVAAVTDPDQRTSGGGLARLRVRGVQVEVGLMEEEAIALDPAYFHHRSTGLPLVTWKYGMTLDGQVAAADGSSQWITSEEARADAHRLRAAMDAVAVGAGTLRIDDPRLDVRLEGYQGRQPTPVVVLGAEEPPITGALWEREPIVVSAVPRDIPGGTLHVVPGSGGHPDPDAVCRLLADLGFLDVLLEGGPTLAGDWWRAGMIARGVAYLGSKVGGGAGISPLAGAFATIGGARVVSVTAVRSLGPDLRVDFEARDVHGDSRGQGKGGDRR